MEELNPPGINQDFFRRVNKNKNGEDEQLKLSLASDSLKNILAKEMKFKDLNDRLLKSRQEKVLVKEVVLESEIEFVNSLKQLKGIFKQELQTAINKVNDLYQSEVLKLEKIYKSEVIGNALLDIVKTISKAGWILLMKDSGVYCYKYFNPPFEVTEGYTDKAVKQYEEPVCSLKSIYVNLLHNHITYGSIMLSTEGQHVNCDHAALGSACAGSLEDRIIPLDNSEELLNLLNEIESTYKICHLDSAYYTPDIPFKIKKNESTWKLTGT